jgi:hypothetical protein
MHAALITHLDSAVISHEAYPERVEKSVKDGVLPIISSNIRREIHQPAPRVGGQEHARCYSLRFHFGRWVVARDPAISRLGAGSCDPLSPHVTSSNSRTFRAYKVQKIQLCSPSSNYIITMTTRPQLGKRPSSNERGVSPPPTKRKQQSTTTSELGTTRCKADLPV